MKTTFNDTKQSVLTRHVLFMSQRFCAPAFQKDLFAYILRIRSASSLLQVMQVNIVNCHLCVVLSCLENSMIESVTKYINTNVSATIQLTLQSNIINAILMFSHLKITYLFTKKDEIVLIDSNTHGIAHVL